MYSDRNNRTDNAAIKARQIGINGNPSAIAILRLYKYKNEIPNIEQFGMYSIATAQFTQGGKLFVRRFIGQMYSQVRLLQVLAPLRLLLCKSLWFLLLLLSVWFDRLDHHKIRATSYVFVHA